MEQKLIEEWARSSGFDTDGIYDGQSQWIANDTQLRAFARMVVEWQKKRDIEILMELHTAERGRNNLYKFAARLVRDQDEPQPPPVAIP
jgi:hypothetical protein